MKEKQIQKIFLDNLPGYWDKSWGSAVFELKLCKGTSIAFDHVADHQIKALTDAKHNILAHKIADVPVSWLGGANVRGTLPKPFDCFVMAGSFAYVVIVWYVERVRKTAYYIDIDKFIEMRDTAGRKSATENMCKSYATFVQDLKTIKKEKNEQ